MTFSQNVLMLLSLFLTFCLADLFINTSVNYLFAKQIITENCGNQIDDDDDGLIDCFDPDCACTAPCLDNYYNGCEIDCEYVPNCSTIEIEMFWQSEANTGNYPVIVAGDIDADGIPEVIAYQTTLDTISILDGQTGEREVMIISPVTLAGGMGPAIGDIDLDGFGEIILVGNDRKIYCYEHDGNLKYVSTDTVGYDHGYRWSVVNLADVDHNGEVEIIIGNQVYESLTGNLLASGGIDLSKGYHPARDETWFNLSFPSPVIIDALPDEYCEHCDGLEIVAGNQVLSIDIAGGQVKFENGLDFPYTDGYTSIADFDLDGDLDAIIQGKVDTQNTVYVWDLQTAEIIREFRHLTNSKAGASRPNVADLDGDGAPEISFISKPYFYALDNDFSILWSHEISDPSGVTVSTVFDFCGTGAANVIYRDTSTLSVFDGPTGEVVLEFGCASATHIEMPIILDVDADGQTEILITCGPSHVDGYVVALKSAGEPWIPSRQVWNQHAYFNTNINDDLTIPVQQQNPHIVGGDFSMNNFLNQYSGSVFPAADAQINLQTIACENDSILINMNICNAGDNILSFATPISFYDENPTALPATLIGDTLLNESLDLGNCVDLELRLPAPSTGKIYAIINDDHSLSLPFDLLTDFPVTAISECNFQNNIDSVLFGENHIAQIIDTVICSNQTITIAGILLSPDTSIIVPYTATTGCDSLVQYNIIGINDFYIQEEYTICQGDSILLFDTYFSDPETFIRNQFAANGCDSTIEITLNVLREITVEFQSSLSCLVGDLGSITAISTGGEAPYSFLWNTLDTTESLVAVAAGSYMVTVSESTGCSAVAAIELSNATIELPSIVSTPTSCNNTSDGQINISGEGGNLLYSLDNLDFQTDTVFTMLSTGDQLLYMMDENGCIFEEMFFVDSPPELQVSLPEDVSVNLGDSLIITSTNNDFLSENLTYEWSPPLYLDCTICEEVLSKPLSTTTYTLSILNEDGCTAMDEILIEVVKNKNVYIPNAFSPNADGINDRMMIYSDQSIQRVIEFKIFDRWGELVFENSDFQPNQPAEGWNGTFLGKLMNNAVLVYFAKVEFIDGDVVLYQGNFTIIK